MVASSTVWEREKKDTVVGSDPGVVGRADVPALILGVRKLKFREKAIVSSRLHRAQQNRDLNLAVGAFILLIASPLLQHLPLWTVLIRIGPGLWLWLSLGGNWV